LDINDRGHVSLIELLEGKNIMLIHQQVFLDKMLLYVVDGYGMMIDNQNGKIKNGK